MIQYFDIDPDHKDGVSKFEQAFGCDYVEPGSFEVYDRLEYESFGFNSELFAKLVPFVPKSSFLDQIDFTVAKSVFYIKTQKVSKTDNGKVKLFGPMKIEKFDFE